MKNGNLVDWFAMACPGISMPEEENVTEKNGACFPRESLQGPEKEKPCHTRVAHVCRLIQISFPVPALSKKYVPPNLEKSVERGNLEIIVRGKGKRMPGRTSRDALFTPKKGAPNPWGKPIPCK